MPLPSIGVTSLDGSNGFRISGESEYDGAGNSVSSAGDINGDGFADLIIGAYRAGPTHGDDSGASYVIFGGVGGFPSNLELSSLDGVNGFKLAAGFPGYNGYSVSAAGDMNGDGIGDLLISNNISGEVAYRAGVTYVVFGTTDPFPAEVQLSTLNGTDGFRIVGTGYYDVSGYSVSTAGDINGDGFDDIVIGALGADYGGHFSGSCYVVFGSHSGFAAELDLSALDGTNGFRIDGLDANDRLGRSVSDAGDVNADGYADFIVSAHYADPNGDYSGASYVVFGHASGFASEFELTDLDGSNGFVINGSAAYDYAGRSVAGAGDINGDGFDDVIVGSYFSGNHYGPRSGVSYVVFGQASGFAATLEVSALDGSNGFRITGERSSGLGGAVDGAGDVNNDGFADLIIGAADAYQDEGFPGASYVVYGHGGGFAANLDLTALDGTSGFEIIGAAEADHLGGSVSGAGDVNNDGYDDVIVGTIHADPNGLRSGAGYVIFGSGTGGGTGGGTAGGTDGTGGGTPVPESAGFNGTELMAAATACPPSFYDMTHGELYYSADGPGDTACVRLASSATDADGLCEADLLVI